MKTPFVIHCARLLIFSILSFIIYTYHLAANKLDTRVIIIIVIPSSVCLFALVSSFIRKQWFLWLLAIFCTIIPLVLWLWFDTSGVVHGAWWEWLIMLPAQMAIPVGLSYTLLVNRNVRTYFGWQTPNQS